MTDPEFRLKFLELLGSPEGRALIAECMRHPPVRMPDGLWREPTPGSEARPGDMVRQIWEPTGKWMEVERVDGEDTWLHDGLRRRCWRTADVEVVMPAEIAEQMRLGRAVPISRERQETPPHATGRVP